MTNSELHCRPNLRKTGLRAVHGRSNAKNTHVLVVHGPPNATNTTSEPSTGIQGSKGFSGDEFPPQFASIF